MGFSPRAVDAMSFWEFSACVGGWNRAQGGEESVEPPTTDEYDDMLRRLG